MFRRRWLGIGIPVVLLLVGLGLRQSLARSSSDISILLGGAPIIKSAIVVADFDGDADLEIVTAGSDGILYVIAYDGSTWNVVWSRQTASDINVAGPPNPKMTNQIDSAPAIADMDNDGQLEIIVNTGGLPMYKYNGGVLVYEYQGGGSWSFAIAGDWPQPKLDIVGGGAGAGDPDGYWDGIYASPAIGDLDGDGDLEIVFQGEDRRIHAYHHNGIVVDGWPFSRDNGDPILRGGLASPALGDLDGDGLSEIVVGGLSPQWDGDSGSTPPDYNKAAVWALHGDSTIVAGWPQYANDWVDSSPALGDIDDDGELEIVVGTGRDGISPGDTGGHYVHAWNADGSVAAGWPHSTHGNVYASPALGDVDGDGNLDIVVGCGLGGDGCEWLYAWHADGNSLAGFPMKPVGIYPYGAGTTGALPYAPILADYDGDDHVEILIVVENAFGVSVVERDGSSSDTTHVAGSNLAAPPVVADLDNDGLLEIVVGGGIVVSPRDRLIFGMQMVLLIMPYPGPCSTTTCYGPASTRPPPNSISPTNCALCTNKARARKRAAT